MGTPPLRGPRMLRKAPRWRPASSGTAPALVSSLPDRRPSSPSFDRWARGIPAVPPTRTPHRRAFDRQVGRRTVPAQDDRCW